MSARLRQRVAKRAGGRCEYCPIPEELDDLPFHIDHIIARKHGGKPTLDNLALACFNCSLFKGPNIAGIDPVSNRLTRLFHARRDHWSDHFHWDGPRLVGLTPIGRATIEVLRINLEGRQTHRRLLISAGLFFPDAEVRTGVQ